MAARAELGHGAAEGSGAALSVSRSPIPFGLPGIALRRVAISAGLIVSLGAATPSRGQSFRIGEAVLSFGGEVSGSLSEKTHDLFNETEYERSLLRLFRVRFSTQVSIGSHVALLAEARSDNLDAPSLYALFLRITPWQERALDVQIGQIPPVFGAFGRRYSAYDNPLIGFPLAYHYLTTIRDDATPASSDDLEVWRGHGAFVRYPIGSTEFASGLPIFNAQRWDTGAQLRVGSEPVSLALAVTQGTLSRPRVQNDNGGVQLAGRLGWKPSFGVELGVSAAQGPYAETALLEALPEPAAEDRLAQTSLGADVEYATGHLLVRGELIWTQWEAARVEAPLIESPLRAFAAFVEARYKIIPGLYVAARADHLGFSTTEGSRGAFSWDADVTRLEAGLGYSPWRRALVKASYQHNWRDGGPERSESLIAGQVVLWF